MTQITPELLNAVMKMQGAPNTTDNLNRIAEFAAVNPGMLEKYIGAGGTDSAMSSVTNSIAATDGVKPNGLADPNGMIATVNPATGMSNVGPRLTQAPNVPARTGGMTNMRPQPGASRQLNYGPGAGGGSAPVPGAPAPVASANPTVGYDPSTGAPMPVPSGVPDGGGGGGETGGLEWLMAALGLRAVQKPGLPPPFTGAPPLPDAKYVGPMSRPTDPEAQRALEGPRARLPSPNQSTAPNAAIDAVQANPKLQSSNPKTYDSGAPEIPKSGIYDATKEGVRKEVDAENLKNEMKKRGNTGRVLKGR